MNDRETWVLAGVCVLLFLLAVIFFGL